MTRFGEPYERTSEASRERLLRELSTLRGAAEEMGSVLGKLHAKLLIILPLVDNALVLEAIHGRNYTGPNIAEEMKQAESALTRYQATKKG